MLTPVAPPMNRSPDKYTTSNASIYDEPLHKWREINYHKKEKSKKRGGKNPQPIEKMALTLTLPSNPNHLTPYLNELPGSSLFVIYLERSLEIWRVRASQSAEEKKGGKEIKREWPFN